MHPDLLVNCTFLLASLAFCALSLSLLQGRAIRGCPLVREPHVGPQYLGQRSATDWHSGIGSSKLKAALWNLSSCQVPLRRASQWHAGAICWQGVCQAALKRLAQ